MQHAGKRLKCPKCGAIIKVPGSVNATSDDNDWLDLDGPLPTTASSTATPSPAPKSAQQPTGKRKPAQPQKLSNSEPSSEPSSEWFADLPPIEPMPASGPATATGSGFPDFTDAERRALEDAGMDDLQFQDDVEWPPKSPTTLPQPLAPVDEPAEYRAKCPICESLHYVKPAMAGKQLNCSDCHSRFVVPPPPKIVPKPKVNIEQAPTFQLAAIDAERPGEAAPWQKSAAQYLRDAEDADTEEEDPKRQYDNPDVAGWLKGIFGIFLDPMVLVNLIVLSVIGALPAVVAILLGQPLIVFIAMAITLLYFAYVITCAFSILESVANGQKQVSEWPLFNPGDWFGPSITAVAAMVMAAFPGSFLGSLMFGALSLGTFTLSMLTIFALFPFLLLSMLDNGSVTMPISTEVSKSVTRSKESWGAFYFSALMLFGMHFLVFNVAAAFMPPAAFALMFVFLNVGFLFVYFSMIGQLAFNIGQAINNSSDDVS